jgi:DNA-binding NarL/FixJ family response regulator
MSRTRVFLADDHELVRYALRTLLEDEPDIAIVGEAADTDGAVEGCEAEKPDVLILDLRMPGGGGVEACERVKAVCPETEVLVLTSFDEDDDLFGAIQAGACGYLLKDARPDQVINAIRSVADGQAVFDSQIASRVVGRPAAPALGNGEQLSEREMEVLQLMAKGLSNKEIGRALWIGETTVKTHVSHILRKLGQADRTQAVLAAVRSGLVRLGK